METDVSTPFIMKGQAARSKNPAPQATRTENEFQCAHGGEIRSIKLAAKAAKSKHKNNTNSIFILLFSPPFFFFFFFFFSLVNNSADALRSCRLIRLRFVLPYCAPHYIFTVGYEDSVKSLSAHAEYVAHVSGVIILESAERKESEVSSGAAHVRPCSFELAEGV